MSARDGRRLLDLIRPGYQVLITLADGSKLVGCAQWSALWDAWLIPARNNAALCEIVTAENIAAVSPS